MDKRICVISMIVSNRIETAPKVNELLSKYGEKIVGRFGIPFKDKGYNVVSVVLEAETDDIGSLTGKLGQISGVTVKSLTV
ncbi:MAG: TM1266 family iron-only hydrogenase system putative regulator [Alphaproteobacteria bacterium]